MLQIRLNKGPSSDGGSIVKSLPAETVTVACPDHLVLADLPVAKGLGSATSSARVKTIGRRSRRQLGERVHFCVRCDFPIATYGRLTPCEHVFCLDCARSDSMCYLCDDRIQKIQTIKLMEGIFICAAPHCLKSFLKKTEFETHIHETHGDLLQPNLKKEGGNDFDPFSVKQSAASDSSVRAPQKQAFPPSMNSQSREQTPLRPLMPPRMPQYHLQSPKAPSDIPHQNFEASTEKQQQGILSDPHQFHYQQQPFFGQERPPFGFPPFTPDRAPPFYGTPMNLGSAEQGSMAGYPSAPPGFELTLQQGIVGDGLDPQTRGGSRSDSMPPPPPPGPPPPHLLHQKNDSYFSAEPSHDANNYNWS